MPVNLSSGKDAYAVFSRGNGKSHQGGTWYGDSGGPIFERAASKLVAVTSFRPSPNRTGIGGGRRLDQPDDLASIGGFLP
jgi:hypothetical protein